MTSTIVDGIDLAIATGQAHLVDKALCEETLDTLKTIGFDAYRRPGMFGPEIPTPSDAPAHQRLFAFLGRTTPFAGSSALL